jgi:hypothetical protein
LSESNAQEAVRGNTFVTLDERPVPPSISVVETIAEAEGVDPSMLDPPLHQVVDPDALDSLFTTHGSMTGVDSTVSFVYRGYTVVVEDENRITVEAGPVEH